MLTDNIGTWCAKCLGYIVSEPMEKHHIYPKWSTTEPSASAAILSWTVPVHRETCHRIGLQRSSDAAGVSFREILRVSVDDLRRQANAAFATGNLNLGAAIWVEVADRARDDGNVEELARSLVNASSNAAGSGNAKWIARHLDTFNPGRVLSELGAHSKISWHHARGNLERNTGNISVATNHYKRAQAEINGLKGSTIDQRAAQLRREVTIDPSLDEIANEAVQLAQQSRNPWGLRTALLVLGWHRVISGEFVAARDCFENVSWEYRDVTVSWWHFMEAQFGIGLCKDFADHDSNAAICYLLRAQYLSAVLGLLGDTVVGLKEGFPGFSTPMESIQTIGRREMINSEIMSEIRREAITEELQTALFRELRQIA